MEEPPTRETFRSDQSAKCHRPTSSKSQDISHVLASTFKDLYTKEIFGKEALFNLIKTNKGRSSYHDRYVEELQQAHSKYIQRNNEVDILESYILQTGAHAATTAVLAYDNSKEKVDVGYDHQGHLKVNAAFSQFGYHDVLKMNNLISPQDYLPKKNPLVKAPPSIKYDPTRPTIAFTMRMSKEPQDDGYTVIPSPQKLVREMSDLSLTLKGSIDTPKRKDSPGEEGLDQIKPKPKWKEPLAKDRAAAEEKLKKLRNPHEFLRNPRFLPPNAHRGGASLLRPKPSVGKTADGKKLTEDQSSTEAPVPVFIANPSVVAFTDYSVGLVFETTLELKNMTSASRHVRVIPPTTPYFSIGLGRFPGDGGVVTPGMSCKYTVRFAPDSLREYDDFVTVETQAEHLLVVPIVAKRPPPVLTLPRVLWCGCCLVGGVKIVEFLCQNIGLSAGTFCIIPKNQWPTSNLRSAVKKHYSEELPFAVSPSLFALQPGEATMVEVIFFPTVAEKSCQSFTVVCDNCQVKDIFIEGDGQQIALELVSVSGKEELPVVGDPHDLTAEHFVHFGPCNPHQVQHKTIIIRNNVHLELPFYWQIMKPNLHPLPSDKIPEPISYIQFQLASDDVFHVSPPTGVLAPCQEQEFQFTFYPKELKDYHSVCHMVLRDVPQLPPQNSDIGLLQPVCTGSKVSDVIAMEIEVKGSTEPYQVLLEPYAIVIPGEIFIGKTTCRQFKMWNHSKTRLFFHWERISSNGHIMEVEPPTGRIEENECFDFNLIVTGRKSEKVVTSVVCHIEHHHEPISLAVEVSFKGPILTLNVPHLDFGLMELGEQAETKLCLTNITQLEASWSLREKQDHHNTQILMQPCKGVLPPMTCFSVDVVFVPQFCQKYEMELELTVEGGTGCHLSVRAEVQSPQLCLLNCELLLPELFIGILAKATTTLFNMTLLPAHFSWMDQLQGKHAELCSASFDPTCGTLAPKSSMEITVTFVCHTDLERIEVAALCEVQGMKSPLFLNIIASSIKKLSVCYSLPSVSSTPGDDNPPKLLLDFGDLLYKRAVTKQFMITNQSAIPAAFKIEVDYFACHASNPNSQSEKRLSYVKKPLHSVQAKKVEDKAHEEFVSRLLAHGKGAAFMVLPDAGMLGPFETQTVDVIAYNDMWGEYSDHLICKVGELEATLIKLQMRVTGCPVYFQMTGPCPDGQNPTTRFGTHVSGGDTVSRSFRINNPTMLDIRLDWETYNIDPNDRKLVDVIVAYGDVFPLKDADGHEVWSRELTMPDGGPQSGWGRDETPDSEGTSSTFQSTTDGKENLSQDICEDEDSRRSPFCAQKKLFNVFIRPHVGKLSDYPYCVTPQQIVIPAKGSGTIHVSFTPLTLLGSVWESKCVGLALGFLSLDSEKAVCVPGKVKRVEGLDLDPVKMDLLALVKPAVLSVQMEEDEEVLEFCASSGDLLRQDSEKKLVVCEFDLTQTFQLKNYSEMPLHFRLWCQPPFSVLKPLALAHTGNSSKPPTGDSQFLVLQPQYNMQVKVAFHCCVALLDLADKPEEEIPSGVSVIHGASGRRKLMFRQNLLIHHSNNTMQTVPLYALLDLVHMHLSTDSIDFGLCYVGQMQRKGVSLYNQGAKTHWKSVIDPVEGDADVFRVTPDSGILRSKDQHISGYNQYLQITFTPTGDGEFRAAVVITSPLVKTPLSLQLQGKGSFDEAYKSDLMSSVVHSN